MQRQGLESTYLSICNDLNKVLKLWHTDKPLLLYRCGYSQLIFNQMDIKELCKLCDKYGSNKLSLKLKYSELKDRLENGWEKTSIGIRQIEIAIKNYETENAEIESKIKDVATVSFNWL